MFEWKSEYSVNIPSIDGQHQNLFRLAAELRDAVMAGTSQAAAGKVLDRLIQYTDVHFMYEERLLEMSGYADLAEHQAQHRALTLQVLRFRDEFQDGARPVAIRLLKFLQDWLKDHILESDRRYIGHVKENGAA